MSGAMVYLPFEVALSPEDKSPMYVHCCLTAANSNECMLHLPVRLRMMYDTSPLPLELSVICENCRAEFVLE
jgi:hypothetical protein